jgi:hypothetical protein
MKFHVEFIRRSYAQSATDGPISAAPDNFIIVNRHHASTTAAGSIMPLRRN